MLSSLTLLISGVFLYQSKSTIDSSATERLSTILAVAEQMLGQDDASVTTKPSFLWVLRDMQLQMKNDPKTEMMEKLETGHIRKMKKSFKDFDCFTLPRPVDKEEALQDVEKMEFTALKQTALFSGKSMLHCALLFYCPDAAFSASTAIAIKHNTAPDALPYCHRARCWCSPIMQLIGTCVCVWSCTQVGVEGSDVWLQCRDGNDLVRASDTLL
jgi:hypothetical protein